LPPTPLSPDFDPLATSCDLTALSGFGGSLRPCCPKTAPGFALCSVRIVLRRSSLCTGPVELSEDTSSFADRSTPRTRKSLESRACFVRIVLRRSSLSAVPVEPPESISTIAVCSTRPARKLPWHRSVPLGLVRRPTRASRLGRRGRARSSEESQQPGHRRPTKILRRSIRSSLCRLDALSSRRLPGSMNSVSLRPRSFRPKASWSRSVRQMHSPAVALARSIRTQQRCRPYSETTFLPLRAGRTFRRSSS